MRVRCPNGNHEIELDDDMLGARVRCPSCNFLFIVELEHCDAASENIKAAAPAPSAAPSGTKDLAERIYDGLPPLSVMIAVRRQQGKDKEADELAAKLEMTPDDWKALAAYESVLKAAFSLRTSVIVAGVALLCLLPQLLIAGGDLDGLRDVRLVMIVLAASGCLAALWYGSLSLQKINLTGVVSYLSMIVATAGIAFAAASVFSIYKLVSMRSESSEAFLTVLAGAVAAIAFFDLGKTGVWTWSAIRQTEPPEITNRLTEALKYLE